jgi:hypothetical protein
VLMHLADRRATASTLTLWLAKAQRAQFVVAREAD